MARGTANMMNTKTYTYTLTEGPATLSCPDSLSPESQQQLWEWLSLIAKHLSDTKEVKQS